MNTEILGDLLDKAYISLVQYGHRKFEKGAAVATSFSDFDIWYALRGSYIVDINAVRYHAGPADAFLMTPGTTLTLQTLEDSEHLYCHFTAKYGESGDLSGDFADYRIPAYQAGLLKTFGDTFGALSRNDPYGKIVVKSVLKILFSDMLLSFPENRRVFLSHHAYSNLKPLSAAIAHINGHIEDNITGKTLADLAGFNQSYFSRYFKKHTGMSPKQYILKAKMDHACHLLSEKGLSVKETAFLTGFYDPFAFSKQFKRFFGVSPSAVKDLNA